MKSLVKVSMQHPGKIILGLTLITLVFTVAHFRIHIDTDPENMLEPTQPERVFYDQVKETFGIHDMIVVGIEHPDTMFTPERLNAVRNVIGKILDIPGVIPQDVISLTTTDDIRSEGGLLRIRPVMNDPINTLDDARTIHQAIKSNPFLDEKIASRDGKAIAIYVPIQKKSLSYRISQDIRTILENELPPDVTYHMAGLPIAEDTFGHEMFVEMAIVAPIVFVAVMFIVWLLFRQLLFLPPVALTAMYSTLWAMGLLIGTGHTVHIMSSMIPVFLMPIAILDDIHILSEFFDKLKQGFSRDMALLKAYEPLYRPMLFTSLTSAVGFASLALTDIPPVRVFGVFVAFGIMSAWFLTMTLVPAMIVLIPEKYLKKVSLHYEKEKATRLDRFLNPVKKMTFHRATRVLVLSLVVLAIGLAGVLQIKVNDNPVRWFRAHHPIRIADEAMNRYFGGTYMAYLVMQSDDANRMKDPNVVEYMDKLQQFLENHLVVGKTSSIADIVTRINRVLHEDDPAYEKVPDSAEAVGQFLFLYQTAGDPDDLDNFLDREARQANIWIQMKRGNNRDMQAVEDALDTFLSRNPLPEGVSIHWSGLTYINKVWQDLMVKGMLKAILGSGFIVFLLMWIEFGSLLMGVLSMLPLTLAIILSYGAIGWLGRDYDMPIAVCSSLALGLSIDFAIHFLQRFKARYLATGSLTDTFDYIFSEPGRAILRNAIVIIFGFVPLVISPLTPYVTVGLFFATIMLVSLITTLTLLPSLMRFLAPRILTGSPISRKDLESVTAS